MSRGVKATLVLSAIFVSLAVTLFAWRQKTTGGSANNGYTREFQGPGKAERPWKPVISEAQMDRIIAAKQSGDYKKAQRLWEAGFTPEQRVKMEEQRQLKIQRAGEREARSRAILGDKQYDRMIEAKSKLKKRK